MISQFIYKFQFIVFIETWLYANTAMTIVIPGYERIDLFRQGRGGGISIFHLNSLNV